MAEEAGNYNQIIFRYDLDAYGISVKDKEFNEANIFANRIMSNAFLFDTKQYGLIAHILKEIAIDGINVQQSKDNQLLSEFSQKSSKVVGSIMKMLEQSKIDIDELWSIYSDHQKSTRTMFMSKSEKMAYVKPNSKFSKEAIRNLMNILENDKGLLQYRTNELIRGILNETGRFSKVHSLEKADERFIALMRLLQRIDEYVKETSLGNDFTERSNKEIAPLVSEILQMYKSMTVNDTKGEDIDNLLWKMIKIWRLYYIRFMELGRASYSIREPSKEEEGEKSKLVDEITKRIEKDIGV